MFALSFSGAKYNNGQNYNGKKRRNLRELLASFTYSNPLYHLTLPASVPEELDFIPADPWPGNADKAREIMGGIYNFSGEMVQANKILWHPIGVSRAWLMDMHGFAWLRDLRALGGDNARRQSRILIDDWIDNHSRWRADAWSAKALSLRICHWISLHDYYCLSADNAFRAKVFKSLNCQAKHLSRVLPSNIKGVDLILGAKALLFASLSLPDADDMFMQSLNIIEKELPRQVLADGTHFDRNPASILHLLRHLIDIRAALVAVREEVPASLQHAIDRMTPTLRFFMHGDGYLSLFNGGSIEDPLLIERVLQQSNSRGRPAKSAPHTGYERMEAGRSLLLFDVGTAPDPDVDNNAHAGALAFEFSLGRDRLVVNCGHSHEDSALGVPLRGTAAHSTITISDTNSAEICKDGRIGRCSSPIRAERRDIEDAILVDASHDGYISNLGMTHRRRLHLCKTGGELRGEDSITGKEGLDYAVRFHLHPDVKASLTQDGNALLCMKNGKALRFRSRGGVLKLEESLYVESCNTAPKSCLQLVIKGQTSINGALLKWGFFQD